MNYFYYVIDNEENGQRYAHAWRYGESNNLLSMIKQFPHAVTVHQCKTKMEAEKIAHYWNECHQKNGCYMFGNGPIF